MPLAPPLKDLRTGEARYRIEHKLAEGRAYDILVATDTQTDTSVLVRAIRYDTQAGTQAHMDRRAQLEAEAALLTEGLPGLPALLDRIYTANPELGGTVEALREEPLLVVEHVEGETLTRWLRRHHPDGLGSDAAIALMRAICEAVARLHEAGWVHRALAPEHIIIDAQGAPHLIGVGNIGRAQTALPRGKDVTVAGFSAPELIDDQSGRYATPRADLYSLGALLSYVLTGIGPSEGAESPIRAEAFDRLLKREEGLALLIAHLTQPLHAGRFASVAELLRWLTTDTLPSKASPGFEQVSLMEPWTPEGYEVGRLSAGPLVVRPGAASPREVDAAEAEATPLTAAPEAMTSGDRRRRWVGLAVLGLLVLLVVIARSLG